MARVLESVTESKATTGYVIPLVDGLRSYHSVAYFSWQNALFGRWDLFHVHWPEYLLRHRNPLVRYLKQAMFSILILRIAALKLPVVQTLHNERPHQGGSKTEAWLLSRLRGRTAAYVVLNDVTSVPTGAVVRKINHPHYLHREISQTGSIGNGLLYFGAIRDYKGLEALLDAHTGTPDLPRLRIVGSSNSSRLTQLISDRTRSDPRVTSDIRFLDDPELNAEILKSEAVVLPYKRLFNSGSILLALSLGRPVIAPSTDTVNALQREVGPGWIYTYEGSISRVALADAWSRLSEETRGEQPRFVDRDLADVVARHAELFTDVCSNGRQDRL